METKIFKLRYQHNTIIVKGEFGYDSKRHTYKVTEFSKPLTYNEILRLELEFSSPEATPDEESEWLMDLFGDESLFYSFTSEDNSLKARNKLAASDYERALNSATPMRDYSQFQISRIEEFLRWERVIYTKDISDMGERTREVERRRKSQLLRLFTKKSFSEAFKNFYLRPQVYPSESESEGTLTSGYWKEGRRYHN